ncbi:hypothetical protein SAMN05421780_106114 [Flexibacter flexilis DSM 6793]|uniref:Uncharacterized protein n=1 Tax=Flexibacter flexilis DSM 6793 TaxID=927664 RepID=A0A1I1JWG0_9BACT|nr:hypothetical protein [Flexibacter flexilis]SFC52312.1 hypothetical protein SAMN05421780_106114 [Flexibacter flexilis DSM 6793]
MLHTDDIDQDWGRVEHYIRQLTGKKPDLNAALFLIGVQELGKGALHFSKEQKQDLMHIGTCVVLERSGYYQFEGHDKDGWPHWVALKKTPLLTLAEQEKFLKIHIIDYFRHEIGNL